MYVCKPGGQARMNFVRQLTRDTDLAITELRSTMKDRVSWKTVCQERVGHRPVGREQHR